LLKYSFIQLCLARDMSSNPIDTNQIDEFIQQHGQANCYIGITAEIGNRFVAHKLVDSQGNKTDSKIAWYWGNAETEENARAIEENYKNRFRKLQGKPGGGKNPTNVYIYIIIPGITDEKA